MFHKNYFFWGYRPCFGKICTWIRDRDEANAPEDGENRQVTNPPSEPLSPAQICCSISRGPQTSHANRGSTGSSQAAASTQQWQTGFFKEIINRSREKNASEGEGRAEKPSEGGWVHSASAGAWSVPEPPSQGCLPCLGIFPLGCGSQVV